MSIWAGDPETGDRVRTAVFFLIAFAVCSVFYLLLDVALFSAQGLTFIFKG